MGRFRSRVLFFALVAIALAAPTLPAQAGKIFWLEYGDLADPNGRVLRADLDGSNHELVIEIEGEATGMALDADNDRVYWSQSYSDWGQGIFHGGLGGCDELIPEASGSWGIALDLPGGKLYWTDMSRGELLRADLDGSNVETLVGNLVIPEGLALDLDHGMVYWAERHTRVARADLDGSNVETVVSADARDVAVDPEGGKVYWVESGPDRVRRADLDGSNVEDLISLPPNFGFGPWAVALDLVAGKMYWSSANADAMPEIGRADLDGSEPEVLLALNWRPVLSLAVVPAGDGVRPFTCATTDVPVLGQGGGILLILLLLTGSSLWLRRSGGVRRRPPGA